MLLMGRFLSILVGPLTVTRKYLLRPVLSGFLFNFWISFSHAQNGVITGKVTGNQENLPLATVSLGTATILTDHYGGFLFSITPGSYTLVITYTGYKKIVRA